MEATMVANKYREKLFSKKSSVILGPITEMKRTLEDIRKKFIFSP